MLPLNRYDPQHTSRSDCSSKQASLEAYECEHEDRQMDHQAGHLVCHATESFRLHRRIRLHYVVADGTTAPKQSADSGVEVIAIGGDIHHLLVRDVVDGYRRSHYLDQCLGRPFFNAQNR